jgi:hypothetical protein
MKTVVILTQNLHQRDGISAQTINLILVLLEAGLSVQVFNLGRSSSLAPLFEAFGDDGIYVNDGSLESWSEVIQKIILNSNWRLLRATISKILYEALGNQFVNEDYRIPVVG